MIAEDKFYNDTVLAVNEYGRDITVAGALLAIDSFLVYIKATFDVTTEPFSTAIKAAKCTERILHNQSAENITTKDIELLIDAMEKASATRWPEREQEFEQKALLCKVIIALFKLENKSE